MAVMVVAIGVAIVDRWSSLAASPTEASAKQFASSWLKALASDDLTVGLVLTYPPHERPAEGTDLAAYFATDDRRRRALEKFHEDRLVRMLQSDAESQFTYTRTEKFDPDRGEAVLWYRIDYVDPTEGRSKARVELHLQYAFGTASARGGWWVREIVFPFGHEYVLLGTEPINWAATVRKRRRASYASLTPGAGFFGVAPTKSGEEQRRA